jgi:hypothetical protein
MSEWMDVSTSLFPDLQGMEGNGNAQEGAKVPGPSDVVDSGWLIVFLCV